jgi:hypothetical protein
MFTSHPETAQKSKRAAEIPPLTVYWVRLVLGFGVSVAVGLAPYLGKLHVPLFTPMLSLIPESIQPIAIPLSAASMGIVAVLVQWYGSRHMRRSWLHSMFMRSIVTCIFCLIAMATMEFIAVVRVYVPAVKSTVSFAVGLSNPNIPPCTGLSRTDCIKQKLSLDEAKIETYFGERNASITKLLLVLVYVTFMSMFGVLVGLMMLMERLSPSADRKLRLPAKV